MRLYEVKYEYDIKQKKIKSITQEFALNTTLENNYITKIENLENVIEKNLEGFQAEQTGKIQHGEIEHEKTYKTKETNAYMKTNTNLEEGLNTTYIQVHVKGKQEDILNIYGDTLSIPALSVSDEVKESIKEINYLVEQEEFKLTNYLEFLKEQKKKK